MSDPRKGVLLVDDHPLFREGLRSLIERSGRFRVAGEAGTGREALRLAAELGPELVTMDLSLPDVDGADATRGVLAAAPGAAVLVVSMHGSFGYVAEAMQAGARGYLVKDAAKERLVQALETLERGETFLDSQASQEVLTRLLSGGDGDPAARDDRYALLSPREQQVMRLVAEGLSSREIAARLDVSPKTAENHRANLMKKLGIHSGLELVRYAARLGLIDVDRWMGERPAR